MAMSTGGGQGGAFSDINVTPLVDVMLVLLIIFMVTAPILAQGVDVNLPAVKGEEMEAEEKKLILYVTKDKSVYLGTALLGQGDKDIPGIRMKLTMNARLQAEKELYLHADRSLRYDFVVKIMAAVKEAGVDKLGMVTDPVEEPSS
jgi:biopolymer transport protein TolR